MKYALPLLAGLLGLAIGLCWFRSGRTWSTGAPKWGQAQVQVSERAYYIDRISVITKTWRDIAERAELDDESRIVDPVFTCLVVDTTARRVWIESDGHVLPDSEIQLPAQMEWKLHRATPEGMTELAPLTRLRIGGTSSSRLPSECVFLVGTQDRPGHLYFSFGPGGGSGAGYGHRSWSMPINWDRDPLPRTRGGETYGSIVASEEDYERAKVKFGASDRIPPEPAVLQEAKAAWRRVEKGLYREIERQLLIKGLPLRDLRVTCGPGYTAASAWLYASRDDWLRDWRPGPSQAEVYLQIDDLGHDVWYARSAPRPDGQVLEPKPIDLEFLVPAAGKIARESVATLLAEGRRRHENVPLSKWRVSLPHGVSVELIGVCEEPSGGQPWWGPDGSPLGYVPYVNYERHNFATKDCATYEIAWRVRGVQEPGSGTRIYLEGNPEYYCPWMRDRYGDRIREGWEAAACTLDRSQTKTTLRIRVQISKGEFAWVAFKNISLVRGVNQGFEIIPGDAAPDNQPSSSR